MDRVIDIHVHPAFFEAICSDAGRVEQRRQALGLYKAGVAPLTHIFNQMKAAQIEKLALLPLDLTTQAGLEVVSNQEVARLVDQAPQHFIGFASIDPFRPDALPALEKAFTVHGLAGLKLHPARQHFYPSDPRLDPIYQMCVRYDRPVIFHAGLSLQPGTLAKFAQPLGFEDVAAAYPKLRICLAHFGWPWVKETAALLLKYPNLYADTALLYFDSALEFYTHVFQDELGRHWVDRSLRHQVMFGSNNPRFEQMRMVQAIHKMGWRDSTVELVLRENALEFLGSEG